MLWQCSTFMSQIQDQELHGHNVCSISAFLTDNPLQKPERVQYIQSPTVLELLDSKECHEELQFLETVHLQTTQSATAHLMQKDPQVQLLSL